MSIASNIEAVTVFRRGARVTRRATITLANTHDLRIDGLPLCLDDASVRVRFESDGDVAGALPVAAAVRIGVDIAAPDPRLATADDEALDAASDELRRLEAVNAQVGLDLEQLQQLDVRARPELDGEAPQPSPTAARTALLTLRARRRQRLEDERLTLTREIRDAERRVAELRDRNDRSSTARQPRAHELRKCVVISLSAPEGQLAPSACLLVDYVVPGARWAPTYSLRLTDTEATIELRAQVGQNTGEDWTAAQLTLSTAAADAWTELTELASRRIGRKQPPSRKRGWRAPPPGADGLFSDYDRARRRLGIAPAPRPEPAPMPTEVAELAEMEVMDAVLAPAPEPQALGVFAAAAPRAPAAASMAMEMEASSKARDAPAKMMSRRARRSAVADDFGGGGAPPQQPAPPPEEPRYDPKLAYAQMRMQPPNHATRGTLTVIEHHALYLELAIDDARLGDVDLRTCFRHALSSANALHEELLAPGHHVGWSGHYDYAYVAETPIDVPSDGEFHNIVLSTCSATADIVHVVVPRESEDVFRVSQIPNALGTPLIAGPVDVYLGTDFLLTSNVAFTPPGGLLEVGLGVAQGVKVARNTRYREETAGLMKGSLVLHHTIEVEVANHSGRAIDVEVRERVPVLRDDEDDIKLEIGDVRPPWAPYDPKPDDDEEVRLRGGYRWRLSLEEGDSRELLASYMVRIAAKHELVGGNRREA